MQRDARARSIGRQVAILVLALLVLVGPTAMAVGTMPPQAAPQGPALPLDAQTLSTGTLTMLPAAFGEPERAGLALLSQWERSGTIVPGVTAFLAPFLDQQAAADPLAVGPDAFPPTQVFYDARPVCDLDGDGLEDYVVQRIAPSDGRNLRSGASSITVHSGGNHSVLWERDNEFYVIPSAAGLSWVPAGEPAWSPPENVIPLPDLDDDGRCDFVTFSFDFLTYFSTPILGDPSIRDTMLFLRGISGDDGEPLWEEVILATSTVVQDNLFVRPHYNVQRVQNLPTGIRIVQGSEGPHIFVKLTDIEHRLVQDAIGFTGWVVGSPVMHREVNTTDRIELRSAVDGGLLWTRDISDENRDGTTDITWIAETPDLTGDGVPDLVLEQMRYTNPQSTLPMLPVVGEAPVEYGRGLRLMALDGHPEAAGMTIWREDVVPHEPVDARTEFEESHEILLWTRTVALQDITGDGIEEVVARYLTMEDGLPASARGSLRTHIVPLDGTDGGPLWHNRVQGWAALSVLDPDPEDGAIIVGSLDILTDQAQSGRIIDDRVRLQALRSDNGEQLWAYDEPFPLASGVSFNIILDQMLNALAPTDLDQDGIRDVLTPARGHAAEGVDQVLLATQTHDYALLAGASGEPLLEFGTWGGQGLTLVCAGEEDIFTVFSGHARRYDITRIDAATGTVLSRTPIFNDPSPRAATSAIALTGVTASCSTRSDDTLFITLNMGRYSFIRDYEVVSIQGIMAKDGSMQWLSPGLFGEAGNQPFIKPFATLSGSDGVRLTSPVVWLPALLGLVAGLVGTPLVRHVLKRRRAGGLLKGAKAIALVLLFAVATFPGAAAALGPVDHESPTDIAADPIDLAATETLRPSTPVDPEVDFHKRMLGLRHTQDPAASGVSPASLAGGVERRFDEEKAFTYTFPVQDIDHDGVEDIMLDAYCIGTGCYYPAPNVLNDPAAYAQWFMFGSGICSGIHWLFAVSGATGDVIWDHPLDTPPGTRLAGCTFEYVIGTVPLPYGDHGIIVYRLEQEQTPFFYPPPQTRIYHDIYMLSARSGEELWRWTQEGVRHRDFGFSHEVARHAVINPFITLAADPEGNGTVPLLYVQGVGWDAVYDSVLGFPMGWIGMPSVTAADFYLPEEWLAQIDVATGTEPWRSTTFSADGVALGSRHSVYPRLIPLPRADWFWDDYYDLVPPRMHSYYWDGQFCCGDLTGDGIPDLVYDVVEWNPTPLTNHDGPYLIKTRLAAFDGASGTLMYDLPTGEDLEVGASRALAFTRTWGSDDRPRMIGDVNGDGNGDYFVSQVRFGAEHDQDLVMRSGPDGAEIWRQESIRAIAVLPTGDLDDDGAPDLIQFDWYAYEVAQPMYGDRDLPQNTNLTYRSGRDGSVLRVDATFNAPVDLIQQFGTHRVNGIPDLDGDGVGDHFVDDPVWLDDQTVIHQLTGRSTRDGSDLWSTYAVGTFAIPARAPDLDGDGTNEVGILSGDVNDLWITLHDGADGTALWSRRVFNLPISNYASALPDLRIDALHNETTGRDELVLTFHMAYSDVSYSTITYLCCGENSGQTVTLLFLRNMVASQVLALEGQTGDPRWEMPPLSQEALLGSVQGPTPGTQVFLKQLEEHQRPWTTQAMDSAKVALPGIAAFLVGALVGVLAAAMVLWARTRDADLPDIDL